MKATTVGTRAALVMILGASVATAEEASSIEIDVGASQRVGGRGITDEDRRAYERAAASNAPLTEETLPPPGAPGRFEALHELARRDIGGRMWSEACAKYDLLREEGGAAALRAHERGTVDAVRSYLRCADEARQNDDLEAAEALLRISESIAGTSGRHEALRWKLLRDRMHERASAGDLDEAHARYEELTALRPDEGERIGWGEQLAAAAWAAHEAEDELRRDHLMRLGQEVAPNNVELRRLADQLALPGQVFRNIVLYGAGAFLTVGLLTLLSRWRSRARVGRPAAKRGRRNPFIDDEEEPS